MQLFMLRDAEPVRNSLYPPAGLKRRQKDIAVKATLQEVEELRMVTLKARKEYEKALEAYRVALWKGPPDYHPYFSQEKWAEFVEAKSLEMDRLASPPINSNKTTDMEF